MNVARAAMHLMACQIERQITNMKLECGFFRYRRPSAFTRATNSPIANGFGKNRPRPVVAR